MAEKTSGVRQAVRLALNGMAEEAEQVQTESVGMLEIDGKRYPVSPALAQALRMQEQLFKESKGRIQQHVSFGSDLHVNTLSVGYNISPDDAAAIIRERDVDPARWPLEVYSRAKALLAGIEATPMVMSDRQPWRRERSAI